MTAGSRLDGGVPADSDASRDVAIAALARRVAELEHRLNMMKVIIGLVLAAKVVLVAMVVYIFLVGTLAAPGRSPALRITAVAHEFR